VNLSWAAQVETKPRPGNRKWLVFCPRNGVWGLRRNLNLC